VAPLAPPKFPQSQLAIVGLRISGDTPPDVYQPTVIDGTHLRWSFVHKPGAQTGFPWHGYFLFRRRHEQRERRCLSGGDLTTGPPLPSDPPDVRLRLEIPETPTIKVWLTLVLGRDEEIVVTAFSGFQAARRITVSCRAGAATDIELAVADIDAIGLSVENYQRLVLCYTARRWVVSGGWTRLADTPYPIALPVIHPDYPLTPGLPVDRAQSESIALSRIRYGQPSNWQGAAFSDLHDQLIKLVESGPAIPMADVQRSQLLDLTSATDPTQPPPKPVSVHPLDLVLLPTVHPAASQMLGLYWIDRDSVREDLYDYLLVADHGGAFTSAWRTNASEALSKVVQDQIPAADWCYLDAGGIASGTAPPVDDPRTYRLPGATIKSQSGAMVDANQNAGVRWDLGLSSIGSLLAGRAVAYHLWRTGNLGMDEPAAKPGDDAFSLLTQQAPILVAHPAALPSGPPRRPPGWPPFPIYAMDRATESGWYSYAVTGIDLFGRHAPRSAPASWYEWKAGLSVYVGAPAPAGDVLRHPFAIQLIDLTPPPPPPGIEAYALDPVDTLVVRDAAYTAWRSSHPGVIGLRVRWRWGEPQMQAAPDTAEFRIYHQSGSEPPLDRTLSSAWESRVAVVAFGTPVNVGIDPAGRPLRTYEAFLAAPASLTASQAVTIVYANLTVSAADDKVYTADNAKWATSLLGNRTGNEGQAGSPAKVFVVHRVPPVPPIPPPDSEKVYATPADYHALSYYTYRWVAQPHLKAHVFRALDEALFQSEIGQPPRSALDPVGNATHRVWFPSQATDPTWTNLRCTHVASELNALIALHGNPVARLAAYRGLSNDALRVLASLPGNERVFQQLTVQPLDPDAPQNADRRGPDSPANYAPQPGLRAYQDTLNGRSANRYFYRAAYVDAAGNKSALSLSGPPIWLPKVVPPRAPVPIGVNGGDREIRLRWASNRDTDVASYAIHRADDAADADDLDHMMLVATIPVAGGAPAARPAEVSWLDTPVPGLVTRYYRLTAVDSVGNVSRPSKILVGRAFDESFPPAVTPTVAWTTDVPPQARAQWTAPEESRLERRSALGVTWETVGDWRPAGSHDVMHATGTRAPWYYRVRTRKSTGALSVGPQVGLMRPG
jgi:hypothetical protein